MMPRTINLRIFKDEQPIGSRSFSREVIKIGKLRSSDLQLEADAVARMHAVLEVTEGEIRLVDLGSASGTTINGERVHKSSSIAVGDSMCFGPYRVELESAPTMAAAPAMAPAPAVTQVATAAAVAVAPSPAPAPVAMAPRATLPVDTSEVEQSERHVAEVVAQYGETMLDVQHVGQVHRRSQRAPAWLALGGLMLLGGAGLLANEVMQDWEGYQAAREEALQVGRAAPEAPGTGLGGLGLGLALLGLVPFGLGLSRREDEGLDRYTIGEGHDASFHVSGEGLPDGAAFPLVRQQGDDYVLSFTAGMSGRLSAGGQSMELHELVGSGRAANSGSAYAVVLPAGSQAEVEHAGVTYLVRSVARGKVVAGKSEADKPFWAYNAASFLVLGGLLGLMHLVPEDALSMSMDELTAENRYVGYINQPDEQPEQEEVVIEETADSNEDPGGQGQRHKGAEGKMGDSKAKNKSGLYAMKGPKTALPTMARNFDPEMMARTTGILGLMAEESGHFIASPYGSIAMGNDDEDVWGGLTGTEIAASNGVGGLGVIGTGRGGGGNGEGTLGLGNVGLMGRGAGGSDGLGYGRGSGIGHPPRKGKAPQVRQGKAVIKGTIDKDVIRRIVRNHHNEVRHCYNQGLSRNPNLSGRVAVMFTIGPSGLVPTAAVSENTIGDSNVANCVAKAVKRWKFPKPASGGSAMVTYPFSFTPG
ncbi:MAG: TonB family protein [Myxococcales bacterium]|nr:TonB family protein [Myxococcales bacterium]